jgi:hypothetical protein
MRFDRFTALTGAVIFSLILAVGCSDDNQAPAPTNYGSLDDPQFTAVQDEIENAITGAIGNMDAGFVNLTYTPGDTSSVAAQLVPPMLDPGPGGAPDSLWTSYSNGWYYVYAIKAFDGYMARLKDSVQYKADGVVIEGPGGLVDYVHNIANWSFISTTQDISHIDLTGRSDFELANLDLTTATINGTCDRLAEVVYMAGDTSLAATFNFHLAASNLAIAKTTLGWGSACPVSGTVQMTLAYLYTWQGPNGFGTGNSSWNISIGFTNGLANITATNGATTWNYQTQICDLPQ